MEEASLDSKIFKNNIEVNVISMITLQSIPNQAGVRNLYLISYDRLSMSVSRD